MEKGRIKMVLTREESNAKEDSINDMRVAIDNKKTEIDDYEKINGFRVWHMQGKTDKIRKTLSDISLNIGATATLRRNMAEKRLEILSVDKNAPKPVWKDPKGELVLAFGDSVDGQATVDLMSCTHLLITGKTRHGKSHCIKSVIKSIKNRSKLIIIDPKHELDGVTDAKEITEAIRKVHKEMAFRVQARVSGKPVVLVIDEFAQVLKNKHNYAMIYDITSLGGSSNIHLVAATQSAKSTDVHTDIKRNITGRMSMSVATHYESDMAFGRKGVGAENIVNPGEGFIDDGNGDIIYFRGYLHTEEKSNTHTEKTTHTQKKSNTHTKKATHTQTNNNTNIKRINTTDNLDDLAQQTVAKKKKTEQKNDDIAYWEDDDDDFDFGA